MAEFDLSKLPTGRRSWQALLEYALTPDHRIERYFLEVKSQADLSTATGRAKVAKFILGAANRDPDRASRRLGGHAIMLLGVGENSTPGVPAFEAKDLEQAVTKLIGVDGPRWDFERIPTNGSGDDVIAIVVDPPTGAVWTCRADGVDLFDGDIYVRADGSTRKAKGDEVRAMIARAQAPLDRGLEVGVSLAGSVFLVSVDPEVMSQAVAARGAHMRSTAGASSSYSSLGFGDTRSRKEFMAEVSAWEQRASQDWQRGIRQLASSAFAGVALELESASDLFLNDVRVDLTFDAMVVAEPWIPQEDLDAALLFPGCPESWGHVHRLLVPRIDSTAISGGSGYGYLRLEKDGPPVQLSLEVESLRPRQKYTSDDDDFVLLIVVPDGLGNHVGSTSVSWELTARELVGVHRGQFEVEVTSFAWTEAVRDILDGPRQNG